MRIGYPCINRSLPCKGNKTFRLKSYSENRFIETVTNNLNCLQSMLEYNKAHNILFFRISSDIIPFASHPILSVDWITVFKNKLKSIGDYIRKHEMRISMHPDQFIVLNTKTEAVLNRSIKELEYHAAFLDELELDTSSKIQLHVGGVYNDKKESMNRFVKHYDFLSKHIKKRLVIENDDRNYTIKDCLYISKHIHIPVLLDVFHHQLNNNNESVQNAFSLVSKTWKSRDGIPMIDYSSQEKHQRLGKHANHIDRDDFNRFLKDSQDFDVDVMLEIKDKEKSAIEAITDAKNDPRFIQLS